MTAVGPPQEAQASDEFFRMCREERLTECYPDVAGLLAGISGPDFLRAGQFLGRLDPEAVLRAHPGTVALTVAVTGHGTLAPLVPVLTAELARHGMLLRPVVSAFDSYVFDLADPGSALYAAEPDVTLCVLDPMTVFDEVPVPWRPADVEQCLAAKLAVIEGIVATFEATSRGTLVLNTIPLPHRFSAQLVDHRSRAVLGALWREANAGLLRLAEGHPAVVVVDLEPLIAEGVPLSDPRLSIYTKAYLSPDLLALYAREVGHLARALVGRGKKCLVVDLDGTVWGGVLGDDGVDGVEVAESYRGEAYRAFQQTVKQLGSQGVLLAVASKNELSLVREALRDRRDMTLREEDFVRVAANWRPKHENLAELASALNLGVDSFVFVDDNPYECGLVRELLPGVTVVQVDGDPALHVGKLVRDGWFDTRELTAEDSTRVEKYRDELVRKDFLDSFDSVQDYLTELKVQVRLGPVAERDVPRLSQLTLRTNQFNLTTQRLQQPEVRALLGDPDRLVLSVHSSDRFGDNGLVGAVFARRDGEHLHIDNAVLSCRVFSRGIEQAWLAALLGHARAAGLTAVYGEYRPTAKNGIVAGFYPRYGFTEAGPADGGGTLFRHDLREPVEIPDHVTLDENITGGRA
ncbi:HAD-IIIC family phosphatase [Streptomyces sp. NRRL F-5123]|uniref:HAD-IIIC family phosphatase n=1 Tax=Streptomyces sp. NRRL F-5123 TaxID=1463856 RepID=UPI0004E1E6F8|nr:HAD-IIIC family phosphatase [Streptomyces sp. NRRL F-5123]